MMVGALQPWHLIIILVIVLLVFGPGKLPELGKAVGDGLRELKRGADGGADAHLRQVALVPTVSAACSRCQSPLQPNAKFCGACGASLEVAAPIL